MSGSLQGETAVSVLDSPASVAVPVAPGFGAARRGGRAELLVSAEVLLQACEVEGTSPPAETGRRLDLDRLSSLLRAARGHAGVSSPPRDSARGKVDDDARVRCDGGERVFDIHDDLRADRVEHRDQAAPPIDRASPADDRATDSSCLVSPLQDPLAPLEAGAVVRLTPDDPPAEGAAGRRALLAELTRQIDDVRTRWRPRDVRFATGIAPLDEALDGGLARAAIHEFLAPRLGSAARSLALGAAARAALPGRKIMLLDIENDFYPPAAVRMGISLDDLIIIRVRRASEALLVCEQALRCRAVAAVVAPLREMDAYVSRRLQLAAETGGGVGLFIRVSRDGGHTFAATRLRVDPLAGSMLARRVRMTVLKLRDGRPGAAAEFAMEDVELAGVADRCGMSGMPTWEDSPPVRLRISA